MKRPSKARTDWTEFEPEEQRKQQMKWHRRLPRDWTVIEKEQPMKLRQHLLRDLTQNAPEQRLPEQTPEITAQRRQLDQSRHTRLKHPNPNNWERKGMSYDLEADYALSRLPNLYKHYSQDSTESKHFLQNNRKYNSCFQVTSFGANQIRLPGCRLLLENMSGGSQLMKWLF